MIDLNKCNNFLESFEQFGRLGLSSRSFSIEQPASITKQPCQDSIVWFFWRGKQGTIKLVNVNY